MRGVYLIFYRILHRLHVHGTCYLWGGGGRRICNRSLGYLLIGLLHALFGAVAKFEEVWGEIFSWWNSNRVICCHDITHIDRVSSNCDVISTDNIHFFYTKKKSLFSIKFVLYR